MTEQRIGTQAEWQAERDALLADEKELTRRGDELARKRRELPWVLVEKDYRGRGIARAFFAFIERDRPFDAVALSLEVSPKNTRARALYEGLGFEARHFRMMTRRLAAQ